MCHADLALHGGARFETAECVVCHNPGSTDANSGNSVDMTVMTHKIHMGSLLPSVIAGGDYCIYGFRDSKHCYENVVYPQSITNCSGCHDAADPNTPDAANWYAQPTKTACGACHDDVDFATGDNHGSGIVADNSQCISCHANNPDSPLEVRQAHRVLTEEARQKYQFNIIDTLFTGPGTAPQVTFSLSNPIDGSLYDLATDPTLQQSTLRFRVAWETIDYNNYDNGASNAQPGATDVYLSGILQATANGDGTFDLLLSTVPSSSTGSGVITLEGKIQEAIGDVAVEATHAYFAITDANALARRVSVEMSRCNDCHEYLSFHGNARNNLIENCQVCHNADAARGGSPSRGPMDMKHFLHRIHATDGIAYPQATSNCTACHTDDGFYPLDTDSGILATSLDRGADSLDPTDNIRQSPNTSTCGVCHQTANAVAHMQQNGGSFDACQEIDGTLRQRVDSCGPTGDKSGALVNEPCAVCHGPGRTSDVKNVHGL
jgi:OmcA/MtrC family decaheme c-type cytochrome